MEQWSDAFQSCSLVLCSLSNCSLLDSRLLPFQRSKYTGGVALRMRKYIAVKKLSRKCVQLRKSVVTKTEARNEH